ncbi:unnamed protein product [Gemmata massiliana]|uniref:Uncharacterized protein n=1 Tax=Gemmata massiliana TaxID=1210884 RepID=A0A6P2D9T9_9BACT|nr:hypothetical protein [Gemmata massiliana]VTR96260.1 unnamed protein product [Gemmata massiliana]
MIRFWDVTATRTGRAGAGSFGHRGVAGRGAMGTTYHYASLTKREWFSTDTLGGNSKFRGLGLNLTARGFDLLLVRDLAPVAPAGPVRAGRWAGDAVAIISDTDDEWLRYYDEFADLTADIILLVVSHDGFDRIGDAAAEGSGLFMELCHLVVTRQTPVLEAHMRARFGARFWSRYQDVCREHSWFKPGDIARPGSI